MQQTAALKGMKECWPDRQPQASEEGLNAADGEVSKVGGGGGFLQRESGGKLRAPNASAEVGDMAGLPPPASPGSEALTV